MQDFRGHITILPNLKWADYSRILSNPTELDMQRYISRGEQSSWPHIESIRYSMTIEATLVESIRSLAKRTKNPRGGSSGRHTSEHGFLEH